MKKEKMKKRGENKVEQLEAKKCPRCRLINPYTALRCDCGYDFVKKSIEKPYFKQRIPKDIKIYIEILVPLNLILAVRFLVSGDLIGIAVTIVWSIAVYSLYFQLLKKKNWARIALIILTFPLGLFLGLSHDAKMYCLQKD